MKIIETERIYLRKFTEDDIEEVSVIYSDEDVMRYIGIGGRADKKQTGLMLESFIKSYEENAFGLLAVIEKGSDEIIGHCGFSKLKSGDVEIAYLFSKKCWGKGMATEAAEATLRYGFSHLKLAKIVVLAYPQNLPSINVIQKIGLKPENDREFFGINFRYFSLDNSHKE
ncbi:MAG: GNAT family N-acetyltransferase [bacterium]|nr:GNAT family N-acetyltransferase [bacterium]